ncbi:MAG: TRL domain-containing protein [Pseudomonadota bacterium]
MIRSIKIVAPTLFALLLTACASFVTPVAVLAPQPEHKGAEPDKIGVACAKTILWVFSYGDSHISKAKEMGGITDIATVEVMYKVLLADFFPLDFYRKQCTEVAGYS